MAIIAHDAVTETLDPDLKVTVWGLYGGNTDVELGVLTYRTHTYEQGAPADRTVQTIDKEIARIQLTREQARALAAELEAACGI